jgi:hypothetical protein
VNKGDRIAQLICERIYIPELDEIEVYIYIFFMFTSVEIKAQNGGSRDHMQGSHYFQIGGRSDFSFRELAGRS